MSRTPFDRGRGRGGRGLDFRGRDDRGRGVGRGNPQAFQGYRSGRGQQGRGSSAPTGIQVFSHLETGLFPSQNKEVQMVEDAIARDIASTTTETITVQRMPFRPGYGTRGRQILLWANYFELVTPPELTLFRYTIDILPDRQGRKTAGRNLRRILEILLEENFAAHRSSIATDYKANIISRAKLDIKEDAYETTYRSKEEDEPSPNAKTYRIRLFDAGILTLSEFMDYLTSTNASAIFSSKAEMIQALNIIVGQHPKDEPNTFSVGASKHFDVSTAGVESMSIGAGLNAIRGFFLSIRAATSRVLLNIQVKHSACYEEGPLDRLIYVYLEENGQSMTKLAIFLKKIRIQVTHIVKKNKRGQDIPRIKTITSLAIPGDGRDLEQPPVIPKFAAGAKEVKFFVGTIEDQAASSQQDSSQLKTKKSKAGKVRPEPLLGSYISVYDFFRRKYNITVRNANLPVINVGTRQNPSYLPTDVCMVLPGQPSGMKLSPTQTQQMIRFAVRNPVQNAQSIITSGARVLGIVPYSVNPTLNEHDIGLPPKLIVVPGRVLTGPDVRYREGKIASTRFGSWNMQSIQFSTRARLASWTYLWISVSSRDAWESDEKLAMTLNQFQNKLKELGMEVGTSTPGLRVTLNTNNVEAELDTTIRRFVNHPTRKPPALLLVILPYIDPTIYNSIKLVCDVKVGLLNVCVVGSKFAKERNDQYFANVALKFNLKLGGRNQVLENNKFGVIAEGKTMVVGIDVTHPSPGSASNAPSVAGMVASIDQWLGQWPADLQIQTARQEIVAGLDEMLKSRLRLWAANNRGVYPEKILVYRDGVSESQYDIVLDQELPLLRKACAEVYPASETQKAIPRISIVIVGKRHNTRFYPTRIEDADRSSNPQNGTIVDRGVTEARNWDFFLQAHTAIQGTARPAHYYVVLDEIFRNRKIAPPFKNAADTLEDLTHNMCYLFGRATKAVSICPPAYYADLVCERARCYLGRLFDTTPEASSAGSMVAHAQSDVESNSLSATVKIHENVRDSMFYI